MGKLKTKKAFKKRATVTAKGKIRRMKASKRHLLSSKSSKRKRTLGRPTLVSSAHEQVARRMLPYEA